MAGSARFLQQGEGRAVRKGAPGCVPRQGEWGRTVDAHPQDPQSWPGWWCSHAARWVGGGGMEGGWGVMWGRSDSSEGLTHVCPRPGVVAGARQDPRPRQRWQAPALLSAAGLPVSPAVPPLSSFQTHLFATLGLSVSCIRPLQHLLPSRWALGCFSVPARALPCLLAPLHPERYLTQVGRPWRRVCVPPPAHPASPANQFNRTRFYMLSHAGAQSTARVFFRF